MRKAVSVKVDSLRLAFCFFAFLAFVVCALEFEPNGSHTGAEKFPCTAVC